MAIYVDDARIHWRGGQWCHMLADSLEELHMFARLLGVHRRWFHRTASYPHYDITVEMRDRAIDQGALLSDKATIILCARVLKTELIAQSLHAMKFRNTSALNLSNRQSDLFRSQEVIA
ncbi:DUF4031 domain-containing protein [Rhodoferax sp.]|uniref:DUF4031 domain-containing protein n=1 Tax=Rhodoferax sp. TaxID=50421 RepID=UPI00374D3045